MKRRRSARCLGKNKNNETEISHKSVPEKCEENSEAKCELTSTQENEEHQKVDQNCGAKGMSQLFYQMSTKLESHKKAENMNAKLAFIRFFFFLL